MPPAATTGRRWPSSVGDPYRSRKWNISTKVLIDFDSRHALVLALAGVGIHRVSTLGRLASSKRPPLLMLRKSKPAPQNARRNDGILSRLLRGQRHQESEPQLLPDSLSDGFKYLQGRGPTVPGASAAARIQGREKEAIVYA